MSPKPMKVAVLGAGAMGSAIGSLLQNAGNDVTLIDIWREAVDKINQSGLQVDNKAGQSVTTKIRAVTHAKEAGLADLLIVFVKCYHTEEAIKSALSIIGPQTVVLSLQNGWGNGPRITSVVGAEKLLLGVCYHSASVLGPGHVLHAGKGPTFIGEPDGKMTGRLQQISGALNAAGFENVASPDILREIWAKLALNAVTLPTSASTRVTAERLLNAPEMVELMRGILGEIVAVAAAQKIPMDFDERWNAIAGLLGKLAPNTKGSMLQDVERSRVTEIDVINGAIIEAGKRLNLKMPLNEAMVALIKAMEATFTPVKA